LSFRRQSGLDEQLVELLGHEEIIPRIPYRREEAYLLGEAHLHLGQWEEASGAFSRFVDTYPSDSLAVPALLGMGEASYRLGERKKAVSAFLRAKVRASEPDLRWIAARSAGWIQRELGDTLGARSTMESLLAEPLDSQRENLVRLDLAELEFAEGRVARAIDLLDPWTEALSSTREGEMDPRGYHLLGWGHFSRKEWPRAEPAFRALLRTSEAPAPEWIARAHAALGWIHLQQGDVEEAQSHYERSMVSHEVVDARNVYGLALAQQRQGSLDEALSLLDGWSDAIPGDLSWRWSFARGFILFQLGHYAEVPGALTEALTSTHPDTLRFHAMLLFGDAQRESDLLTEALEAYRTAAALVVDPPEDLLWRWAVVSLGLERWGEASRVLKDLLTRHPGSSRRGEQAFWRGESLYRLGRYGEAEDSYAVALKANHSAGSVHYGLGWCAYVRSEFRKAARHFGAALEKELPLPQAADAALRQGHALSNLREWESAGRAYGKAQDLGRGTSLEDQARFRRAWLLLREGKPEDAGRAWEKLAGEASDRSLASHSLYWAGQAWFASSSYEDAIRMFRHAEARVTLPDSMRAAATLGAADALYNLERWNDAQEMYRSLISKAEAPRTIRTAAADGVYNTLIVREDWDEASSFLDEITRVFPEISGEGERHLRVADGLMEAGDLEKAARAYASLTLRRDLPSSLRERGLIGHARALEGLGRWGDAAERWEEAGRHADPGRTGAFWMDAVRLYVRESSWRDAVRLSEELKGRDVPLVDEWRLHIYLAQAYERLERFEPAAQAWRETAVTAPSDTLRARAWANAGRLLVKTENWDAVLDAYGRVDSLGSHTDVYRASYWMGEALYRLEEWERAEALLADFVRQGPEEALWEAMARMRRASCLEQLERWDGALDEYETILTMEGRGLAESFLEEARIRMREVEVWSDSTRGPDRSPGGE
jgi:tetratricopeptide (TPR) repeat protein